nr:uncharacterized protein LOC115845916 [Globicephala melas]
MGVEEQKSGTGSKEPGTLGLSEDIRNTLGLSHYEEIWETIHYGGLSNFISGPYVSAPFLQDDRTGLAHVQGLLALRLHQSMILNQRTNLNLSPPCLRIRCKHFRIADKYHPTLALPLVSLSSFHSSTYSLHSRDEETVLRDVKRRGRITQLIGDKFGICRRREVWSIIGSFSGKEEWAGTLEQHRTDAAPDVEDADVCQFQNNSKFITVYGILQIPQFDFEEKIVPPPQNIV